MKDKIPQLPKKAPIETIALKSTIGYVAIAYSLLAVVIIIIMTLYLNQVGG